MKVYREGKSKIITEVEESDCKGDLKTIEMVVDAIFSGMKVGQMIYEKKSIETIDKDLNDAMDDFDQRWEIIRKTEPPAGGEDAR